MTNSRIYYSLLFLFVGFYLNGQNVKMAFLNDDGIYEIEKLRSYPSDHSQSRSDFELLEGFPVVRPAHPSFKNFRNVSIADVTKDGNQEILVCMNEILYCINFEGEVLWQSELIGTSNFPPAISDIDDDGNLEIAVQTYTVPSDGRVYLFDHLGKVKSGWPISMNNHFFLNAVTFADMNQDGHEEVIASERVSSTEGKIHVLDMEANSIATQWPVTLNGTPAFTPSVADLNQDQSLELISCSTSELYIFTENGEILPDYPISVEGKRFSYQSPLVFRNFTSTETVILGARHGDAPDYFMINEFGLYNSGWPISDSNWNYATPAVADIDQDGDMEIFFGRLYVSETVEGDILLGFDENGNNLEGFPITGFAGSEGLITIADIDNDGQMELLTSSKITEDNQGFIHAYEISTGQEVEGFPLRVPGFTFLNGAYLGDVNGDNMLDLTALSYQLKFDNTSPDSAFVSVFDLEVPYEKSKILFNGYKGANHHRGAVGELITSVKDYEISEGSRFSLAQNPVSEILEIITVSDLPISKAVYKILNTYGQVVQVGELESMYINVTDLSPGHYFVRIEEESSYSILSFQKF